MAGVYWRRLAERQNIEIKKIFLKQQLAESIGEVWHAAKRHWRNVGTAS
jgi:hypothetical protein